MTEAEITDIVMDILGEHLPASVPRKERKRMIADILTELEEGGALRIEEEEKSDPDVADLTSLIR